MRKLIALGIEFVIFCVRTVRRWKKGVLWRPFSERTASRYLLDLITTLHGDVLEKKGRAIRIRSVLQRAKALNHETVEFLEAELSSLFGRSDIKVWNLENCIRLFPILAPDWRLLRLDTVSTFKKAVFCRRDDETIIREGRKVAHFPEIAILSLMLQIYIEDLEALDKELKEGDFHRLVDLIRRIEKKGVDILVPY